MAISPEHQRIIYYIVSASLLISFAVILFLYFKGACSVENCDVVVSKMSYAQAVEKLESMLEDEENRKKFVKHFFEQLKNTCVANPEGV